MVDKDVPQEKPASWANPRYGFFKGLGRKMITFFVLLVLLPLLAVTAFTYSRSHDSSTKQTFNQLNSVITLKEQEINNWLDANEQILSTFTESPSDLRYMLDLLSLTPEEAKLRPSYTSLREALISHVGPDGQFEEIFLINNQAQTVFSSDEAELGKIHEHQRFFQVGRLRKFFIQGPTYNLTQDRLEIIMAKPVGYISQEVGEGKPKVIGGMLVARLDLDRLSKILVEHTGMGDTGETYLVSNNYLLITPSRFKEVETGIGVHSLGVRTALGEIPGKERNGQDIYDNYRSDDVVGVYHWLSKLEVALLAEQSTEEAFAADREVLLYSSIVAALAVLLAILGAIVATRYLVGPVIALTETATDVAAGNLDRRVEVSGPDEIGVLGRAFNSMTSQLRDLIQTLEERVAERTRYLEASSEVGRAASSILSPDELLQQTVELIRDHFGYYHVSIFLLDEEGQYAILRESTGAAGRILKSRGHKLAVGSRSVIGWVTANRKPRIAADVGQDATYYQNELLPETRSELAIPLIARGRLMGALDVQSTETGVFGQEIVNVLQGLGDQLAVALENARLFQETSYRAQQLHTAAEVSRATTSVLDPDKLLKEVVSLLGESFGFYYVGIFLIDEHREYAVLRAGLGEPGRIMLERNHRLKIGGGSMVGWVAANKKARIALDVGKEAIRFDNPLLPETRSEMALPLQIGERIIGVIDVQSTKSSAFGEEDTTILQTMADQMAAALDNARLFRQTQESLKRTNQLYQTTQSLLTAGSVDEILQSIVNLISTEEELDGCGLLIQKQIGGEEWMELISSWDRAGLHNFKNGTKFPYTGFPFRSTLDAGQIHSIDVTQGLSPKWHELLEKGGVERMVFVPMRTRDQMIGLFCLWQRRLRPLPPALNDLAEVMASQATISLENRRLFAEAQREALQSRALYEASQVSSRLGVNLEDTLTELFNSALNIGSGLNAVFATNDELAIGAARSAAVMKMEEIAFVGFDGTEAGLESVRSGELAATIAQQPSLMGRQSIVAVLRALEGLPVDPLTVVPVRLAISDTVDESTIMISRAEAPHLSRPYTIGVSLGPLNSQFYQSIRRGIETVAEETGIKLILESHSEVQGYEQTHAIEGMIRQEVDGLVIVPLSQTTSAPVVKKALSKGLPVVTLDEPLADTTVTAHISSDNLSGGRLAATFIGQELNGEGRVGLIFSDTFSSRQRLQGFEEKMAESYPSIQSVRLQATTSNRVMGSRAFESATQQTGFDRWWVALLTPDGEELRGVAGRYSEFTEKELRFNLDLNKDRDDIAIKSLTEKRPFVVNNPLETETLIHMDTGSRKRMGKFVVAPVMAGEQAIGVVTVGRPLEGADLEEQDIQLALALASQVSVVAENRRLFEETEKLARREKLINEITSKIHASINMDNIMQTAVRELGQALGARRAALRLGVTEQPPTDRFGELDDNGYGNGG